MAATLLSVLEKEVIPPRRLRPEIPPELEAICLKCLAKDSEDRYGSASELAGELNRFLQHEPLKQTPPSGSLARLKRWVYQAPGLATRLATVFICSTVMWANRFATTVGLYPLLRHQWTLGPFSGDTVWVNQIILVAWGLGSIGFQTALNRRGWSRTVVCAWLATDVTALTLLLMIDNALVSPLTVAYAVLIAASGLWSRRRIVLLTTVMAMVGYAVLAIETFFQDQPAGFVYWHLHFLAGLAIVGGITAYQARRLRTLGRFIERRPVP